MAQPKYNKQFFQDAENILVYGSAGTGKTTYLKDIIENISKDEYRIILVDSHRMNFEQYKQDHILLKPIIYTQEEFYSTLVDLSSIAQARRLYDDGVEYKGWDKGILLIVDEYMSVADPGIELFLQLVLVAGNCADVHVVLSTQSIDYEVMEIETVNRFKTRINLDKRH